MFPLLIGIGVAAILVSSRKPAKDPVQRPVSLPQWQALVEYAAAKAGLDAVFVMKWIAVESGGNPCSVGGKALGPDGNPREIGLAQLYNPDDLNALGLSAQDLRAYCIAGSQKLSRPLSPDESVQQVDAAIRLIVKCKDAALSDLAKVGARWNERDVCALTKLQHAMPGLSRSGIVKVTNVLGRPPSTFGELKAHILGGVAVDAGTKRYRSAFAKAFANAEKTAAVVSTRS